MMTLAQEVGQRLRESRKAKKLTQVQVSIKLGIPQQHYSLYEKGKLEMDYERIVFICKLYGISTEYLLGKKQ